MVQILVVGKSDKGAQQLENGLQLAGAQVTRATEAAEAFTAIAEQDIEVVLVLTELNDVSGLVFVRELVRRFPLLNCGLASDLQPDDFHEETEGLGLFVQLPASPSEADAIRVLAKLRRIGQLLAN